MFFISNRQQSSIYCTVLRAPLYRILLKYLVRLLFNLTYQLQPMSSIVDLYLSTSTYLHMYKCILVYLPVYLAPYQLVNLSSRLSIFIVYLPVQLSSYLPTCLSSYLHVYVLSISVYLSSYLPVFFFILYTCLLVFFSTFYLIYLSTCFLFYFLSYLPFYLSSCLLIYLSACVHVALEPFLLSLSLPRLKRAESGADRQLGRAYLTLVPGTGFPASFTHQQ